MKRFFCSAVMSAVLLTGCGDSFFSAHNYLTGPVDGVGLKKSTSIIEGGIEQLHPVVTPARTDNKKVSWKSGDPSVASVDRSGTVTAIKPGNAVITVTTDDGGFTASCDVTVAVKPVPVIGITVSKVKSAMLIDGTEQIMAEITPAVATNQNITWTSEDSGIADVDQTGLVRGRTQGVVKITATSSDGGYKSSCTFAVSTVPVYIAEVRLNKASTAIKTGKHERLFAIISPSDATDQNVTWRSSNPSVASVDQFGFVTGISEGDATITAETREGGYMASALCRVRASEVPVAGISITKTSTIIVSGTTEKLVAEISPADATDQNIIWSSSSSGIASVDSSGTVLGVSTGSAVITARSVDGGSTALCSVIVTQAVVPVTGVALNKTATAIEAGMTEKLFATVEPVLASDKSVTWSTSDGSVATVDNAGTVRGVSAGSADITVTTADGGKTAKCLCTVSASALYITGLAIQPDALSIKKGSSGKITSVITPSNATNQNITWRSSKTSVATVDSSGIVTGTGGGTSVITATTADGTNISDTCTVTVTVPVESISIYTTDINTAVSAVSLNPGGTIQLNTAFVPVSPTDQSVTWESSNTSVAAVTGSGLVTGGSSIGKATVKVTASDGGYAAYCVVTLSGYAVKYNANGGSGELPDDAEYAAGATVTVESSPAGFAGPHIQDGIRQRFLGWFTQPTGGTNYGGTFIMPASDVTLYAQFTTDSTVIRKTGPGGGFVFYDCGNYTTYGTWRYIEAAPASTEWTYNQWGSNGYNVAGTYTAVGSGQSNTLKIKNWLDANTDDSSGDVTSRSVRAAYLCDSLISGGYDDWFLPSYDELGLIWQNLYSAGIGGFAGYSYYFSSSQSDSSMVYAYYLRDTQPQCTISKPVDARVRAVRRF